MDRFDMPLSNSLSDVLVRPEGVLRLAAEEWNSIILHARRTQTLGQLMVQLTSRGLVGKVPAAVLRHLTLSHLTAQRRAEAARWEIDLVRRAISSDTPIILLKGCAYLLAKDANAEGRFFSDIDVLVPKSALGATEAELIGAGWMPGQVDAYDQRYYREWSHEVPPMEHVRRHTVIDLHHAIIPPISRYRFPTELLLESVEEIGTGIHVLGTADRVIHCAVHLILEGAADKVFRDLYDLHLLLEQHFPDSTKRAELHSRARRLGLDRFVAAAVRAADAMFCAKPAADAANSWLASCLKAVATGCTPGLENQFPVRIGRIVLLALSHWMKMPVRILIPHLARKTVLELFPKNEEATSLP
ncbi:MAG: nucleotidyltransferase family protein [Propionivibrio sp.]